MQITVLFAPMGFMARQRPATRKVGGATISPAPISRMAPAFPAKPPPSPPSRTPAIEFPLNSSIQAPRRSPRSGPRPTRTQRPQSVTSTTYDLMAAWAFGDFPFVQPDPSAAYRTTLGYTYGKVFQTSSLTIPAYGGANYAFPDFSQASIFDNPPGKYAVRKEAPQFSD